MAAQPGMAVPQKQEGASGTRGLEREFEAVGEFGGVLGRKVEMEAVGLESEGDGDG